MNLSEAKNHLYTLLESEVSRETFEAVQVVLKHMRSMDLDSLPIALDTTEFRAAWLEWQLHRSEIRKKLTPTSVKRQLKQLAEMGPARAIAAIEWTIAKGWTGIREPDTNGRDQPMTDEEVAF